MPSPRSRSFPRSRSGASSTSSQPGSPAHVSIVAPGSSCPACSAEIAWYDNIPIVSYLLLRGRCRGCRTRISAKYPLVELATAVLVSACILDFGVTAGRSHLGSVLRGARRHHRHRPRTAGDPESRRAPGSGLRAGCANRGRPLSGLGDRSRSRLALPAPRRARLSRRARHGRREARASPRRRARRDPPGRLDGRDGLRPHSGRRPRWRATATRRGRWRSPSGRSSPPARSSRSSPGMPCVHAYLSLR